MGYVTEQLHQAAILEAVGTRSANFPVRVPFGAFLARWGPAPQGRTDKEAPGVTGSPGGPSDWRWTHSAQDWA